MADTPTPTAQDAVDRRFRLGTVVARPAVHHGGKPSRGIVVWTPEQSAATGHGPPFATPGAWYASDYLIEHENRGHHTVTSMHPDDQWATVAADELTTLERVRCAAVAFDPPDWWDPADGDPPENYELGFALLRALLTPAGEARVFPEDDDWPTCYAELAEAVAVELDARLTGARSFGAAMSRLAAGVLSAGAQQ